MMKSYAGSTQREESRGVRLEIDRLVNALATSNDQPAVVLHSIAEREERLSQLDARIRAAKAAPQAIQLGIRRMEAEIKRRLDELGKVLERNPGTARKVIKAIFDGPGSSPLMVGH